MRAGAYLFIAAIALSSCTQILGIDGRYVVEQGIAESGGTGFGSGGAFDAEVGAGGEPASGGEGGSGATGGTNGAGGFIESGGMSGGGGASAGGAGGRESGGISGGGGSPNPDAQVPCAQGEKLCPTVGCVKPDPSVGCELGTPCTPCDTAALPASAHPICVSSQCDYECYPNYKRNTTTGACDAIATGTGGASGTGGVGGAGPLGSKCIKPTPLSP